MRHKSSLRRRIANAYLLLAIVLCACFAGIAYFTVKVIEDKLINARLVTAADRLIENHLKGLETGVPGDPAVLHGAELAPALRVLAPGMHEVELDGRALHVLIRQQDGETYAIVDDESEYERIEGDIWETLAGGLLGCLVLALVLGRVTASRVIAPVVALSKAVEQDQLGDETPSLHASDEVGVLARALAAHTEEMQRFLVREQLFTGDVSHELRTPLTIILGAAELLQARLGDRPDLLPAIERIRRTAADTAERVSALLLLSRSPESVDAPLLDLEPLVAHEMERCRPLLQGKPVSMRLEVRQAARVFGRAELAATAIGNLVRNACQFTEQGEVLLILDGSTLVVEDTGVGVPEAVRTRVFDRFVRAAPDHVAGTGLGLAIVRRIAEHLGWTVVLEARSGGGSRCVVTFPSTGDASTA